MGCSIIEILQILVSNHEASEVVLFQSIPAKHVVTKIFLVNPEQGNQQSRDSVSAEVDVTTY